MGATHTTRADVAHWVQLLPRLSQASSGSGGQEQQRQADSLEACLLTAACCSVFSEPRLEKEACRLTCAVLLSTSSWRKINLSYLWGVYCIKPRSEKYSLNRLRFWLSLKLISVWFSHRHALVDLIVRSGVCGCAAGGGSGRCGPAEKTDSCI